MRLAIFGDVHGNFPALQAVLASIREQKLDNVYCVGDLVGYGPQPNEVLDLIRHENIFTLMGNYDEGVAFSLPACGCNYQSVAQRQRGEYSLSWTKAHLREDNKAFLRELSEELTLDINGYQLLMFHGSPRAINEYLHDLDELEFYQDITRDYPADIYVYGHTHVPYVKNIDQSLFVNVGSVGLPKDGNPNACYVILDIASEVQVQIVRVPYCTEQLAQKMRLEGLPEEFVQNVRTGKVVI